MSRHVSLIFQLALTAGGGCGIKDEKKVVKKVHATDNGLGLGGSWAGAASVDSEFSMFSSCKSEKEEKSCIISMYCLWHIIMITEDISSTKDLTRFFFQILSTRLSLEQW